MRFVRWLLLRPRDDGQPAEAARRTGVVYFLTPESTRLFEGAVEKDDFWPLVAAFVSEERQTFCGIASSVMALNA